MIIIIINCKKFKPHLLARSLRRTGVQSTLALWTPCYYGHPANTDSRHLTETNSRYYKLSLKMDFHCLVKFYARAHVNFMCINKIEAMYGRSCAHAREIR